MVDRKSLKLAVPLVLAALAGVWLSGCAVAPLNQTPATPDSPIDGRATWVGDYDYEELLGAGEDGADESSIDYHITISPGASGGYDAEITLNGFQTQQDLLGSVRGDAQQITLVFVDYAGDNMWQPYNAGDVLLTLARNGESILTTWGVLQPQLEQNQAPGLYFHGNVG